MHVVHLEDDGPLREILKVAFEAADPSIELHQFVSSNEAVTYIQENLENIDLYVLDIRVPGTMDGIEVAQKIRELNAKGTIVLTSAYQAPERDFLVKLQCEWFPKPWHIMETTKKLFELARKEPKQEGGKAKDKKAEEPKKVEEPKKTESKADVSKPVEAKADTIKEAEAKADTNKEAGAKAGASTEVEAKDKTDGKEADKEKK